ncbi:MAG: ATPase component [Verrucomicrobia bacterium]|nr:MAG: ATPase component [Verrucomicrobiota bacterium]
MLELQDISLLPKADCDGLPPLYRISLRLAPSERCIALWGAPDSGIDELLQAVAGTGRAYTGNILWKGLDVSANRKQAVGFVKPAHLAPPALPDTTVTTHLLAAAAEHSASKDAAAAMVERVLDEAHLTEFSDHKLSVLTPLLKTRLALATALLHEPELVLCGGLATELDTLEENTLLHQLKASSARGRTVLFTPHALRDLTTPDSIIVLHEGQLIFHAPPEHLLHYFDIQDASQLEKQLTNRSSEEWARSWRKHRSTFYRMRAAEGFPAQKPLTTLLQHKPLEQESALPSDDAARVEFFVETYHKIRTEIAKLIVGQEEVIEQLLIAVLAGGHCLLEGVPGLAKTAVIRTLSQTLQLAFRRIQFTPDLMPADVTGTDILQEDPATGRRSLVFQKGPIFTQMLLADEINRTPAKTQAALLEAMQEHSVTAGGHTVKLAQPFFVLATQNPIEQEGTYPLPEAQKDRFLFHIRVGYPDRESERLVIERTTGDYQADVQPVIDGPQILECQKTARRIPVPAHVMDFVLNLVRSTRPDDPDAPAFVHDLISWGAGPRACQCLVSGAKVRAILQGRFHVSIEDIEALALPVLRHRIVPSFQAESEGINADKIILRLLASIPRLPAATSL